MTRRSAIAGTVIVAVYVVVAAATIALHPDHARPLYDSFVPPASYRFVDPPAFFAAGNVKPTETVAHVPLEANGSAPAGIATTDAQFVLDLARGAIAPAPGASGVEVRITPVAPRDLGALPNGLRANGNAYRLTVAYEPTGAPVTTFARPGTLLMEIPELGTDLFTMPGNAWEPVDSRTLPPRQLTLTARLAQPGVYLAGTRLPELAASSHRRSSHVAIVVGVVTGVVALVLFGVAYAFARRRRVSARAHSGDDAEHGTDA